MMESTQDTVSTALGEILGIEQDRVRSAEADRRQREDAERERRAEGERRRIEEEELRARAEERLREENRRREREEGERREHERKLAELRVRRETESRAHLAEEELRLRHERELAALQVVRRRAPTWAWAAMALLAAAGAVAATLLLRTVDGERDVTAAAEARYETEHASWVRERGKLTGELRELRTSAATLATDLAAKDGRLAALERQVEEARADRARLRLLEAGKVELEARIAELEAKLSEPLRPARGPIVRPPRNPPPPPPPPDVTRCVNVGTPLERCFRCPGDPACTS